MAGQVVNSLVTQIDADVEGLRAKLQVAETYIKQLEGKTTASGVAATAAGKQYGLAAQRIASVGEAAVRAGELGAQGAKQLISQGSNIAFMFGPQGAVVGALGIATLAVVQFFTRANKEAEETKKVLEGLDAAARSRARRDDPIGSARKELGAALADQRAALQEIVKLQRGSQSRNREDLLEGSRERLATASTRVAEALRGVRDAEREVGAAAAEAQKKVEEAAKKAADEAKRLVEEQKRQQELAQRLADTLAGELVKATATQVDDLELALTIAIRSRREELAALKNITEAERTLRAAQIDRAATVGRANIEAVRVVERANKALEQTLAPGRSPSTEQASELADIIRQLQAEQQRFTEGSEAYAQVSKKIRDIEEERLKIHKDLEAVLNKEIDATVALVLKGVNDFIEGERKKADLAERAFNRQLQQADAIQDAVLGTHQLIAGLSGADSAAQALLGSILQIATQVPKVATQLSAFRAGTKDEQGNPLASASSVLGSFLPIAAGLVGIIGALSGGKDDPEAQRRAEILEENNRRLTELRDTLGEVIRVSVSGRDIANIRGESFTRQTLQVGTLGGGQFIDRPATAAEVITSLRQAGTSLKELQQVASDFGITLSESPTVDELKQLQEAIRTFSLSRMLETFSGALELFEAELQVFDIDDPVEKLRRFIALLTDDTVGAPAIFGELLKLDVGTAEGREAARAFVQGIFEQLKAGTLDPAAFEGLDPSQVLQALPELIRRLGDAAGDATEPVAGLAEALAAAEAAAKQDLSLRELRAKGLDDEADALEQQIANERELAQAREAGLSAETLAQIAYVQSLEAAARAAREAAEATRALSEILSDAFTNIDIDAAIFGGDAADVFNKKFSTLIGSLPAPAGTGGFLPGGAFDLSTQAGRDEARAALQELARGDATLKPIIVDLIRELDGLPELVGDAVAEGASEGARESARGSTTHSGSLQQMTLYQGDRLITLAETQLLRLTEIRTDLALALRSIFAPVSPIVAPSIPGFGASFANTGVARPSMQIGPIIVHVPAGTENPQAFGHAVGRATLNEILADEMIRERFFGGSGQVI